MTCRHTNGRFSAHTCNQIDGSLGSKGTRSPSASFARCKERGDRERTPVEGLREAPDAPLRRDAPGNLIQLLINMQLLNGVITPIILTFILVLANRRSVLGVAANGPA